MIQEENPSSSKIVRFLLGFVIVASLLAAGALFWHRNFSKENPKGLNIQDKRESGNKQSSAGGTNVASIEKESQKTLSMVSSIGFDAREKIAKVSEKVSFDAVIDPKGKKVSAVELHIVFDPKVLKLENIVPSDIFSLQLAKADINNEKGTALIMLAIPLGNPKYDSGILKVATFDFQSLSPADETEIIFSDQTKIAADGEGNNSVLSSRSSAIVIVRQ